MEQQILIDRLEASVGCQHWQVSAVVALLEAQATIPFIARYRKEATGSLDEVEITRIRDQWRQLQELAERQAVVLKSLETNGHLSDDLQKKVNAARTMSELEDIYLPYKPKRRTRGTMAREKGLEPLAQEIFSQNKDNPHELARAYVDPENQVPDMESALAGARDIMAEWINENVTARSRLRDLFLQEGVIRCQVIPGQEAQGDKYRDYFDWQEPLAKVPSHRMLAMRRGEAENVLTLSIAPDKDPALAILRKIFIVASNDAAAQVDLALTDGYKRLLSSALETEARLYAKKQAETEAIRVFAENLRQLLLAPPLGAKRVMAIDPGFRTGCKLVCLDRQGALLHHDTIFPHGSAKKAEEAAQTVQSLSKKFQIEALAIGNGTAGRETETFCRSLGLDKTISVIMVNESGASVYSASEVAREEFPDLDLTVRGAISIGRRLMDPLAELVKIDPKSIGVGQYQHDVNQKALKQSLDDVVVSCVNAVGVDVNRASVQLLTYVSGLNTTIARNLVAHRQTAGPFLSRQDFQQVSRLGPKAFEQCAGFLRINEAANPLDASAVHPESYHIVTAMAEDLGVTVPDLMRRTDLQQEIELGRYVGDTIGMPTLVDIMAELAKPGRDPRPTFETFSFAEGIESLADLEAGMKLPGLVTNITAFGAFVDIGVHQDGLVHISEMADRFVKDPTEVVKLQQPVQVTVLSVDVERQRIALSLKSGPADAASQDGRRSGKNTQKTAPSGARGKKQKTPPPAPDSPLAAALRQSGAWKP